MNHLKHRSNESIEDYLETILTLQKKLGQVRSIDIANEMNFSKPSVSVAMKSLRENGYIEVMGDGHIALLQKGKNIAEKLYEKLGTDQKQLVWFPHGAHSMLRVTDTERYDNAIKAFLNQYFSKNQTEKENDYVL